MSIDNLGLYEIEIDFYKMSLYLHTGIHYKENDSGTAKIRAKLLKDGAVVDLTGSTATIRIITAKKDTVTGSAVVVDALNGIIEYTFPNNAIIKGINFFEVILSENGKVKTSPRLAYSVIDSIDDSGVEEESNYPVLLTLITNVNSIMNNSNQAIANIEDKIELVDSKIVEVNTTITNVNLAKDSTVMATSNANTKMIEVEAVKQDVIATKNNLVAQFNALAPTESTNVEVQLARTDIKGVTHASIKTRLDMMESNPNIIWETVEG